MRTQKTRYLSNAQRSLPDLHRVLTTLCSTGGRSLSVSSVMHRSTWVDSLPGMMCCLALQVVGIAITILSEQTVHNFSLLMSSDLKSGGQMPPTPVAWHHTQICKLGICGDYHSVKAALPTGILLGISCVILYASSCQWHRVGNCSGTPRAWHDDRTDCHPQQMSFDSDWQGKYHLAGMLILYSHLHSKHKVLTALCSNGAVWEWEQHRNVRTLLYPWRPKMIMVIFSPRL